MKIDRPDLLLSVLLLLLSVDAVDVMTLRLSMTLRLLGLPKDRLTSSKMSSVADGVLLVDESEASTSYELPWIVGVMRLSLLAVLLGGV